MRWSNGILLLWLFGFTFCLGGSGCRNLTSDDVATTLSSAENKLRAILIPELKIVDEPTPVFVARLEQLLREHAKSAGFPG